MGIDYICKNHKIDIVCTGCVEAWINRHDKMKIFLKKMIEPIKDRDDYFECWQEEAKELLKEIGLI